jgi:hypothetical protein
MTPTKSWPALAALVVAVACSEGTAPPAPAALTQDASVPTGTAGLPLAVAPTFVVKDASGNTLGGVPLTIQVTAGGGTLAGSPGRTSSRSPTAVGTWTLGKIAGENALTITVGELQPLVISVTGVPGPPTSASVASGNAQTAIAGTAVAVPIALKVSDQFGNGVPGIPVTFTVTEGGGSIPGAAVTSDGAGVATAGEWRLGKSATSQTVIAVAASALTATFTATVSSDYNPVVRFFGQTAPTEAAAAFTAAVNRIRAIVTGDVPDNIVTIANLAGSCGNTYPAVALNETVDDVVIYATVTSIDGPGSILASAGPCIVRTGGHSSVLGLMRFDAADLPTLIARGQLADVTLHEMLHVVGVGVLWRQTNLISGGGTTDPRFTGPLGSAECLSLGGADVCPFSIPVENTGGSGTADSHWRESAFDAELMTGFVEAQGRPMPLSTMTIQSIADIGYQVNLFAGDSYMVPAPSSSSLLRAQLQVGSAALTDEVLRPTKEVTRAGVLKPLAIQ